MHMKKINKKITLILAFYLIFIGSLNWALPICYSAAIDSRNILTDEQTARKDSNQSGRYQYWELSFQNKSGYKDKSITLGPYKVIFLDDGSKLLHSNRTTLGGDGSLCKLAQCDHHSEKCPFWISPEIQFLKIADYKNHVYILLESKEEKIYIEFLANYNRNFDLFYLKRTSLTSDS